MRFTASFVEMGPKTKQTPPQQASLNEFFKGKRKAPEAEMEVDEPVNAVDAVMKDPSERTCFGMQASLCLKGALASSSRHHSPQPAKEGEWFALYVSILLNLYDQNLQHVSKRRSAELSTLTMRLRTDRPRRRVRLVHLSFVDVCSQTLVPSDYDIIPSFDKNPPEDVKPSPKGKAKALQLDEEMEPPSSSPPAKKSKSKVKENGSKAKGKAKRKVFDDDDIKEEDEETTFSTDERPLPDEDGEEEVDLEEEEEEVDNKAAAQA